MTIASNLGFPRIGADRELKRALESYWLGKTDAGALVGTARELRHRHWELQRAHGIAVPPSNDFALYDHVLDTTRLFGLVPERYGHYDGDPLAQMFAMARGTQDVAAMEMTKWFDTNYHFIVPELEPQMAPTLTRALVAEPGTRPVLVGPVTLLLLARDAVGGLRLLEELADAYRELLEGLGSEWVQIDEPMLVCDLPQEAKEAYRRTYATLADAGPRIMLTTYFGRVDAAFVASLPVHGVHIDLTDQAPDVIEALSPDVTISAGVVSGRNVWRADMDAALDTLKRIADARGSQRLQVAPSCSLLHVPIDLSVEATMDPHLRERLAFAIDKLDECAALAAALDDGDTSREPFERARRARGSVRPDAAVQARLGSVTPDMLQRRSPYPARRDVQRLGLPELPTTTIGSFPQTRDLRAIRARWRAGEVADADYAAFLRAETKVCIRTQEELGLDVLVHGEFERTDMVEHFARYLSGFAFTEHGWVQSYGSRCVKPPIIHGDVARPSPMTVEWATYAQSLSERPVKGMLTGPVTMMKWSFVRDDQALDATCRQIALAIRDEVADLEVAGIRIIQIDEAAFREAMPLREADRPGYLRWAVEAFRLASAGVRDETQIHTHMCYSDFAGIIDAIAAMDADVVSIESSRSHGDVLDALAIYPNDLGPGIYDIHSPRVPSAVEMLELLERAMRVVPRERLWVNPDCGLKTRRWEEVTPALSAMVEAARTARAQAR